MAERIGRAVLELGADASALFRTFGQATTGAKGVDSEFEKLRRSSQGLGAEFQQMVARFDGRRIVDQARLVARAVDQVGGVSRLTRRELDEVARTVDTATDKLRRMGEEVPPSLRKLQGEIDALGRAGGRAGAGGLSSMTSALGGMRTLLPAITAIGAVSFIGKLASDALQAADAIVTYSARTGVSIETTQRWMYVAGQTSTSLESFGNSALRLGVNISTGSNRTKDALNELNLSWTELRNLKPEEQFDRAVAALERVDSVTERNRLGQALFGKQWAEIAVAVAEGYTKIKDAANVAKDAQVEAAEAAGDAWEEAKKRIGNAMIGILGRLAQEVQDKPIDMSWMNPEQIQHYNMLLKSQGDAYGYLLDLERERTKGMRNYNLAVEDGTTKGADYVAQLAAIRTEVAGLSDAQKAQIRAGNEAGVSQNDMAEALEVSEGAIKLYLKQVEESIKKEREAKEATERFLASVRNVPIAFRGWVTIPATVEDTHEAIDEVRASMEAMADIRPLGPGMWEPFKQGVDDARGVLQRLRESMDFRDSLRTGLIDAVADIPGILQRSFEGGGGLGGALQSIATQIGSQIGSAIGQSIGTAMGGPAGGKIGKHLGALIGSIPGMLIGRIGREERHVNDVRDVFTAAAGGIEELNRRAQAAGLTLDRFLRARTVKEYEAAVKELEAAFARLDAQLERNREDAQSLFDQIMDAGQDGIPDALRPAIEQLISLGLLTEEQAAKLRGLASDNRINVRQMEEDIGLFKGRMESLGPAFQQAKIDETSMKYTNAIERMIRSGADVGGVLFDAREELGSLVAEALRSGRTLPENLRPWIEDLVRSGNLIDENGNKITDISQLKWGERMETEGEKTQKIWDQILAKISELVDRISGPLNDALDNAVRDRRMKVDVEVRERHAGDGEHRTQPVPDFDQGVFRGRFGAAGLLSRLHNIESVVPQGKELDFVARVLGELPAASTSNVSTTSQTVAPVAIFYPDGRGAIDGTAINRHLASVSGIMSNDFGLRELIEGLAQSVVRRELSRA